MTGHSLGMKTILFAITKGQVIQGQFVLKKKTNQKIQATNTKKKKKKKINTNQ